MRRLICQRVCTVEGVAARCAVRSLVGVITLIRITFLAMRLLQISSILSVMPPDCGTDCDKCNEAQSGNTPYGVNEDIDSNATAEDLRARARVTRRPNINFFRLGIFAGEKIHFLSNQETDENIYAEIIDSKQKCLNTNAGDTRIFSPLLLRRKRADC